jgi:hypothetical protein
MIGLQVDLFEDATRKRLDDRVSHRPGSAVPFDQR